MRNVEHTHTYIHTHIHTQIVWHMHVHTDMDKEAHTGVCYDECFDYFSLLQYLITKTLLSVCSALEAPQGFNSSTNNQTTLALQVPAILNY